MQDKNLLTGVALSKRASLLGYINAIRELGQARMQVSLIGVSWPHSIVFFITKNVIFSFDDPT